MRNPENDSQQYNEDKEPFEDNSAQQREIEKAGEAAEAAYTLQPEKGIAPEPKEKQERLYDYDGDPIEGED